MLSALKSRLFCGSSLTPFSLKKSASVPEAAGAIVSGGGGGCRSGAAIAGGHRCRAGVDSRLARGLRGSRGAVGATVTVCVTVRGSGSGGSGNTGSADGGGAGKADDAGHTGGHATCQNPPAAGVLVH